MVIYKPQTLGFLYDAGSSSKQKHPKLSDLQQDEWTDFLSKNHSELPPKSQSDFMAKISTLDLGSGHFSKTISQNESSDSDENSSALMNMSMSLDKSNMIENIEESISSCIRDSGINRLIIFLSHPDKDHINLVNNKSIPESLEVIAFLGGDFLGVKSEEPVTKVLDFLRKRDTEKTWVEFPFYWGWTNESLTVLNNADIRNFFSTVEEALSKKGVTLKRSKNDQETLDFNDVSIKLLSVKETNDEIWKNYSDIRNSFAGELTNNREKMQLYSLSEYNPEKFFHGSGLELMKATAEFSPDFQKWKFTEAQDELLKNNVFIWGMNHRLDDVNAQSSVISFKLPHNKVRLVCTGDAEDRTFRRIKNKYKSDEHKDDDDIENILMIPHHGSKNNQSSAMLDLFKPAVFIISAGNGKMYPHPDIGTIEWLKKGTNKSNFQYVTYYPGVIAFLAKKNALLVRPSSDRIILSTNTLGPLRFTNQRFSCHFNPIISIKKPTEKSVKYYKVDFLRSQNPKGEPIEDKKNSPICYFTNSDEDGTKVENPYYCVTEKKKSGDVTSYYGLDFIHAEDERKDDGS